MAGRLTWTAAADPAALAAEGTEAITFAELGRLRDAHTGRGAGTANPAAAWLGTVARSACLAVLGVRLDTLADLRLLHGYVLEPALRGETAVLIASEQRLSRLAPERFIDPELEYPYTLERAQHAAMALFRGSTPTTTVALDTRAATLDAEQRAAVDTHDGVVQVIAPAGSGKTTVLVERVRELLRRSTPADAILCTTFNRDARAELQERLAAAGLAAVRARTFHSIGWWLMRDEGLARAGGVRGELSLGQWRRLCTLAAREPGSWIEPADARAAISWIKLGLLATAAEFRRQADRHENGARLARIYELYERQQVSDGVNDFDDLVFLSVRALREDPDLRARWQGRFRQVLVDEYQDIEPAQELLVRILAAPHDGFFCVGDEDQTLYGWRRAEVRRMLELDRVYPGLERVTLAHNYRCPPQVVDASRRLIEHNTVRFPKPIHPAPGRAATDALALQEHATAPLAAAAITRVLAERRRREIVVLARTTRLLREVALACATAGVAISAPDAVFEPHGAQAALEAYLRLCTEPARAEGEDVALVCRQPARGLPFGAEGWVAARLRDGGSFRETLADLAADERQRGRLAEAGQTLGVLAAFTRAGDFISYLRGPGGLDAHFREHEQTFGGSEQIELEVLEEAQREAAGLSVAEYSELLRTRREALRAIRDDVNGIELTTIHRAKGRQWPEVHVFACEERQLPHSRALDVDERLRAAGEGLEAERRLAYVAFTRAQRELVLHTSTAAASRFLTEAGLRPSAPYVDPAGVRTRRERGGAATHTRAPGGTRFPVVGGDVGAVLGEARRVGLSYALRTAPSRAAALEAAALAVERQLIGPDTTSPNMTLMKLLQAIETLTEDERSSLIASMRGVKATARLTRLEPSARPALVAGLRELRSRRP